MICFIMKHYKTLVKNKKQNNNNNNKKGHRWLDDEIQYRFMPKKFWLEWWTVVIIFEKTKEIAIK